ncbi:hypothetical protein L0U85_09400 [Glycomyces sp. L485]|uniref:hypothetical protein n=1 Tax=Glycomyces sp. L485 TaxID=2909235 RepID=UPI001F4A0FBD|nr:hypothetical protein [Glycomyces sp. L485]MCH7231065.1 hypothetical protein [Glycomyces sp. L485]
MNTRTSTLPKIAAIAGAASILLTGCSGGETPEGSTSAAETGTGMVATMEDWKGCWALDDLQPLQDYLGAESIGGDGLIDAAMGEGRDGEALTCSAGTLNLATVIIGDDDLSVEHTGHATVQMGVVPWETEEIASENYADRLDDHEFDKEMNWGTNHVSDETGQLGGEWDESFYEASSDDQAKYILAQGRTGDWILYISMYVSHDPGLESSQEAAYPFTEDELVNWVVDDYMPQTQIGVLSKIESEQ